jgi:hypothetical protein
MGASVLAFALALAAPSFDFDALKNRLDLNLLVGLGWVGPAQFDQGRTKLVATANVTGLIEPRPWVSLLGLGLAVRSTEGPSYYLFESDNFNEFGVAVPVATFHWGWKTAQIGASIQRANFRKNLYYVAVGWRFGGGDRSRSGP